MTIIWSDTAKVAYEKLIDNLLDNWEVSVAENLESEINKLEVRLKENKKLCPESKKKKLRKCKVHELTSLVYKIKSAKEIQIVAIVQNRMNHGF